MTTTTRYRDTDGALINQPGDYTIADTRVRIVAITRPDGFTVGEQHAVITHTLTPVVCLHCGEPADYHSDGKQACVRAGYYGNRYTPATETTDTASEPDSEPDSGSAFSPEQALADIRAAFSACFTPDFNGVDWRDDKAIQTLAATVYDILDRAAIAQETST